ncbi:MAG: glycosyltransferase family 4 protein [Ardenticatenales bacterium]|nr:glycosyltransferase family 4 protein [Ardenticatenales bacterium]
MNDERPGGSLRIVMLGPFGLGPKMTIRRRALPAARALAARGHAVTLLLPPWHTPAEADRAWDDDVAGVRIVNVSLAGLRTPVVGHAVVAARMARMALALEPDIVHAFKPKAYSGLAATMLWLRRQTRVLPVWPLRPSRHDAPRRIRLFVDTDDWEGAGGWNDLERYSRAQRAVFALQERWGLTHADHVTVASRALEGLAWAMGVPPARVTYLPNAIDDSLYNASMSTDHGRPTSRRPPTLLLYTRFFEFALDRPLDVLARVRAAVPDARLVVAGKGLFGEERRFAELAARRGLADAVEMHGWLDPQAAATTFAQAAIALYPFDDTLVNRTKSPFKLLELMSAGLPIVADAVGELREVVVDGESGRVVAAGDVDVMAEAVVALLRDGSLRERLGDGARTRVSKEYVWSTRVMSLERAYAESLSFQASPRSLPAHPP